MPQQPDSMAVTSTPGTERSSASVASKVANAFWWAMSVDVERLARTRFPRRRDSARSDLGGEVFVGEKGVAREELRIAQPAKKACVLVAKREEARGLEAKDRNAFLTERTERFDRAPRLCARAIDHAGSEVGPSAAERPGVAGARHDHAMPRRFENAHGGVEGCRARTSC
jgi:hypothetical protein